MAYPESALYNAAPDTISTIYPERLIRPLPKKSLRSRLSQEAADAIPFPPNPPSTSLPVYGQYGNNGEYLNDNKVHVQQNGHVCDHSHDDTHHRHDHGFGHGQEHCHHHHHHHHHHCHHGDEDELDDSGEDEHPVMLRRTNGYRSSPKSPRSSRYGRHGGHASKSSSSGLDGYEAFENTNNKKKRKIPTSGNLGLHSTLSTDLAQLGLDGTVGQSSGPDDGAGVNQYYGSGSAALPVGGGPLGTARGRNTRRASGRNPLGVSMNGSNVRAAGSRIEQSQSPNFDVKDEATKSDQGIISAAIANATALLRMPLQKGQENVGVLDQQAKSSPTNSQFTFTCEPDAGKGVTFPEQSLYAPTYAQRANAMPAPTSIPNQKSSVHGPQSGPNDRAQTNQHLQKPTTGQASAQGKKPRRRRSDSYASAARRRRLQQEHANIHHPPVPEDLWICEFCEYKSIFGVPPHALIRQYEVKDRKERRRLAEKRRLLEKAKLKGRKGKKQSKNAGKGAGPATHPPQSYDHQAMDQMMGDEYLDDEYDDDPISMPAPPPQAPSKQQTMPGPHDSRPIHTEPGAPVSTRAGGAS